MPSTSPRAAGAAATDHADDLLKAYRRTRDLSLALSAPLAPEDMAAQSMPDASPAKWHLAHTSWFFETFILADDPDYAPFDPRFGYLFNSYYDSLGPRQPRPARGLLTRPSAVEVVAYRRHVDRAMERRLARGDLSPDARALVVLGLAHEQQHQELLLTDILHLFAQNPLKPAYNEGLAAADAMTVSREMAFLAFEGGVVGLGRSDDEDGFAFDNEGPRHEVLLRPYLLADRLVTNAEWLAFMADDGYRRPDLWLSEGFAFAQAEGWSAPLYWVEGEGGWETFTLAGMKPLQPDAPVTHVSFYEADAYARWRGMRLPTEAEWEHAATGVVTEGNFLERGRLCPEPAGASAGLRQMFGDCWEWTASPYTPYPGYRPAPGAVGEYNGKFMINQMVLRGGSCVTPECHVRATYRNFFHPHQRWQFSGVRLAQDAAVGGGVRRSDDSSFLRDVLDGLRASPKRIPSKYFYDDAGSDLFERICETPEYYPTRTETALLEAVAGDIAAAIPDGAVLIEYGSGASVKTRLLLDASPHLYAYAPMDISAHALDAAAAAIRRDYPQILVEPVLGDFTKPLALPRALRSRPKVGFFPGSTIGNFDHEAARAFLAGARALLGPGALFVVGVDLVKPEPVLLAAYDDAAGVTRDFNRNLLVRINRELGGDFDVSAFEHQAVWNPVESRMEMHLRALRPTAARIGGETFAFAAGETIHTENSYKYRVEAFETLAQSAGWTVDQCWISPAPTFAIFVLKV